MLVEWVAPELAQRTKKKVDPVNEPMDFRISDPNDFSNKPFMTNQRPYISFLTIEAVEFGILALLTLRIKYLWTPHMCLVAALGICDWEIWQSIVDTVGIK